MIAMKGKIVKIAILFLLVGLVSCWNKNSASTTEDEIQSENTNQYIIEDYDYLGNGTATRYEDETEHVDAYHQALEKGYAKIIYNANDDYHVGICNDNRYVIFWSSDWLREGEVIAGDFTSLFPYIYNADNNKISYEFKKIKYNFDDCIKYLAEEDHLDSRGVDRYKEILLAENQYGEIIYEGKSDYYIVSTCGELSIVEFYSGYGNDGDIIYGDINKYGFTYVYVGNNTSKSKIYIEDYGLSTEKAVEWMGEHGYLKYSDQEAWDNRKNDW